MNASRASQCLGPTIAAAGHFLLSRAEAVAIAEHQVTTIIENWNRLCDEAALSPVDRAFLWGRQFLNPFVFDDLEGDAAHLTKIAGEAVY